MSGLEIVLLLMGAVMLFGSFFITEKISSKDVDEIKRLAEEEMKKSIEGLIADAKSDFEDSLKVSVEDAIDSIDTKTDKETNEKIMHINEYSDTVLESMNKSHNEVMFMYSMLNDKQEKIEQLTENLDKLKTDIKVIDESVANKFAGLSEKEQELVKKAAEIEKQEKALLIEKEAQLSMAAQLQTKYEEEKARELEEIKENISKPEKIEAVVSEIQNVSDTSGEQLSALAAFESLKKNATALESKENKNKQILELHDIGLSEIDIAKKLGIGLGEVKFVLGLYQEAK